ncbi:MAG: potassium channel protein [Myxococcales bacterium]|nr:MAG: potassium channel protein [Myxococcales bacterium]
MKLMFFKSRRGAYGRLVSAAGVLATVVLVGATAYFVVGDGRWSWFDCFYMTIITLSTVGFAETLEGMNELPEARAVTIALIILGSGTLLYFISSLTALIVEGDLQGILRRRSMERAISKLNNHVIVCGSGTTGRHIATELRAVGVPFVVIDIDQQRLDELNAEFNEGLLYVVGDATDDHVLTLAGIERARGVISALNDDKANLFVTISARALNPAARIVAKSIEPATEAKLRRAGADSVVAPNYIGGVRLFSEMVSPKAAAFLDRIVQFGSGISVGIEAIDIPPESPIAGQRLAETDIREAGALVVAVHKADGDYVYNPGSEQLLEAGDSLIVLADSEDIAKLRQTVSG